MKRAVVLAGGGVHLESALGALTSAGFEAVPAANGAEARALVEAGAVVVVLDAAGWEGEAARPLAAIPTALRRGCVIALVGQGLSTGDGTRAFLLGADLVIGSADAARLGELACAAIAAKRALVAAVDPSAAARLGG